MAINFPDSPSLNDFHVASGRTWKWNGTVWERIPAAGAQGVQGAQGAQGAPGAQGSQGLPAGGYANKNLIVPDAYAVVGTASSGTGLGMNWGAYNSSTYRMEFTFHYAQANANYYVHTNREHYATHNIEVFSKTTTGFTTKWTNSDGSDLSPATFKGVLIVYASDPIEMVGIGSTGNTGAQGHQGVQGAQGSTGSTGAQGHQGVQGAQGAQGHQGRQGAQGVQGAVGAQGAQGHQGHQGVQGATGSTGAQGVQGAQGHQGVQGAQGHQGVQGAQGHQGVQGADGNFGGATFDYTFNTSTSDADPGAGKLGFNNGTLSSATILYIDDVDGGGTDIQPFIRTIDDSTSTIKGHVRVSNRLNADDYALFTIAGTNTEATGYHKVNVAFVSGATSFSNNEDIIVTFARTGTKGDTGNTGAQGVQGAQGHQGVQGAQGHQGVQGATGAQGHQGVQGAQGHQGHQGVQGAQGRQGATGNTGAQGHQGVQGATGPGVTASNQATNRLLTCSSTNNVLDAESTLTYDGTNLDLGDSKKIRVGASQDLWLEHNGSNSKINNTTGTFYIQGDTISLAGNNGSHNLAVFTKTGSADLYYNNSKKLETTSSGVTVTGDVTTGSINATGELNFTGNGHKYVDVATLNGGHSFSVRHQDGGSYETGLTLDANGAAKLFHNNIMTFQTDGNGIFVFGPEGGTSNVYVYADEGDDHLDKWKLTSNTNSTFEISGYGSGDAWKKFILTTQNQGVNLYYNNTSRLSTNNSGVFVNGTISGDTLDLADNKKIQLGSSDDLQLYFDGTNSIIDHTSSSGTLYLRGDALRLQTTQSTPEDYIVCSEGGFVKLYHHNSARLETTSGGIDVTGGINLTGEFNMTGNGAKYLDFFTLANSNSFTFRHHNPSGNVFETAAYFVANGGAFLTHNGTTRLSTTSAGITVAGEVDATSDIKLKENIKTIENSLDKVLKLRGVEFDWKESEQHSIGVIAQEVEEVLPELVHETDDIKSVSYGNLTAVLIEAIKEQNEIINTMKKEIEELKG